MRYEVRFSSSVGKDFDSLPEDVKDRAKEKIAALASEPRPNGSQKIRGRLKGHKKSYRIRVGDFRIVYTIEDATGFVLVFLIDRRDDVYRSK